MRYMTPMDWVMTALLGTIGFAVAAFGVLAIVAAFFYVSHDEAEETVEAYAQTYNFPGVQNDDDDDHD